MILAKARLVESTERRLKIALSFPTGFDPEEVIEDSVVANGNVPPETVHVDPRRGKLSDLYREFEVCFPLEPLRNGHGVDGASSQVSITGRFRRGLKFSASLPAAALSPPNPLDH